MVTKLMKFAHTEILVIENLEVVQQHLFNVSMMIQQFNAVAVQGIFARYTPTEDDI